MVVVVEVEDGSGVRGIGGGVGSGGSIFNRDMGGVNIKF